MVDRCGCELPDCNIAAAVVCKVFVVIGSSCLKCSKSFPLININEISSQKVTSISDVYFLISRQLHKGCTSVDEGKLLVRIDDDLMSKPIESPTLELI